MKPVVGRGHRVLIRDFLFFQVKLVLDGLKDVVLLQLSFPALLFDLLFGKRGRPLLFYRVLRLSERFDRWLNLNGPAREADRIPEELFGGDPVGGSSLFRRFSTTVRSRLSRG